MILNVGSSRRSRIFLQWSLHWSLTPGVRSALPLSFPARWHPRGGFVGIAALPRAGSRWRPPPCSPSLRIRSRAPPAGASRRGRASRVVTRGTVSRLYGGRRLDARRFREAGRHRARATAGALPGSGPFALLDPDAGYTHVSPGVCDACADDVEARKAWVRARDRSARAPPRGSGTRALASRPPGRTRAPPALPQNRVGGRFPLRTAPPPHLLTPSILPNPPFVFARALPPGGSVARTVSFPRRQRRAHARFLIVLARRRRVFAAARFVHGALRALGGRLRGVPGALLFRRVRPPPGPHSSGHGGREGAPASPRARFRFVRRDEGGRERDRRGAFPRARPRARRHLGAGARRHASAGGRDGDRGTSARPGCSRARSSVAWPGTSSTRARRARVQNVAFRDEDSGVRLGVRTRTRA